MLPATGWYSDLGQRLRGTGTEPTIPPQFVEAYRVLNHPRNAFVARRPFAGYELVRDGTRERLDGLTKPLQDVFYPGHRVISTGGAATGGSTRGTVADKEVADLVNKGTLPADGSFSPYALRILRFLWRHNLQPCAAQFLVYDERIRIATEIDLVCVDLRVPAGRRNVVFIECKTGFERNYEKPDGRFCSPYVPDSAISAITKNYRNTHQLQALVQLIMARLAYPALVRDVFVLVMRSGEDVLYPISRELRAVRYHVYTNLALRLAAGADETQRRGVEATAAADRIRALFVE